MSDVYTLLVDGVLPRLQSLRVDVDRCVIRTVLTEPPSIKRLRMPELKRFDLQLRRHGQADEGEEQVRWMTVETLTSHSVMPRLRRFSLIYGLQTIAEIQHVFQSSLFDDAERHILFRFKLDLVTPTSIDSSDITNICDTRSTHYNKGILRYVSIFPF